MRPQENGSGGPSKTDERRFVMAKSLSIETVLNEIIGAPEEVQGVKERFCKLWPEVKTGLELLAQVFPKLKIIIVIVIAAGDRYCGG
jgi:hypothetical protein